MQNAREELTAAVAAQAEAERRLHRAVDRARADGWSWAEVAEVLGVSRQAAHRRFHAAPPPPGSAVGGAVPARPWWEAAVDVGERAVAAWLAGDLVAVHAQMTGSARAALPQSALRAVLDELEDLAGPWGAPTVAGVHELDGAPLPEAEAGGAVVAAAGPTSRRRAVVVRCVVRAADAEPVVHVLVGPSGRVAGLSARLSDTLEQWPL